MSNAIKAIAKAKSKKIAQVTNEVNVDLTKADVDIHEFVANAQQALTLIEQRSYMLAAPRLFAAWLLWDNMNADNPQVMLGHAALIKATTILKVKWRKWIGM
jgi:hypothetical protein